MEGIALPVLAGGAAGIPALAMVSRVAWRAPTTMDLLMIRPTASWWPASVAGLLAQLVLAWQLAVVGGLAEQLQFLPALQAVVLSASLFSFPPSVRKGGQFEVPDGIIAHLTRECGGNVQDRNVVEVTSGSFGTETNPPCGKLKNIADMEAGSYFHTCYRSRSEDIPHTRNNWVCYDFKDKRIIPTHYTIRSLGDKPNFSHLKSWLVETSVDGKNWKEVDHKELNGKWFMGTFTVAGGDVCRFIRLVNIGRDHQGYDILGRSSGSSSRKRPIFPMLPSSL
jgi:hypothetical protein